MSKVSATFLFTICTLFLTTQSEPKLLDERRELHEAIREKVDSESDGEHEKTEKDGETMLSEEKSAEKGEGSEKCEEAEKLIEEMAEMRKEEAEVLQFTIAVLVAFFIFAYVAILYLVNFQDANIRSYIYQMLSSTMSIFLAVTLNMALFSFWLEQVLPSPPPRGLGIKVGLLQEFVVGVLIFVSCLAGINFLCHKYKENETYVKAVRVIGGHIAAFSGITTFGTVQIAAARGDDNVFKEWKFSVICLTMAILWIAQFFSKLARNKFYGEFHWKDPLGTRKSQTMQHEYHKIPGGREPVSRENEYTDMSEDERKETEKRLRDKNEWRRDICEAEDDACSLIVSFLACQYAIYLVAGHYVPLPPHRDTHTYTWDEVGELSYANLVFLLFLIIAMMLRRSIPAIEEAGGRDPTGVYMRTMGLMNSFWAMCLAWSALRLGDWAVMNVLANTQLNSRDMVHLVSAAGLTGISVLSVILLDNLADKAGAKAHAEKRVSPREALSPTSDSNPKLTTMKSLEFGSTGTNANAVSLIDEDFLKSLWRRIKQTGRDKGNFERALRTVIDAFGLLVGLCWEKASHAATETIVEGAPVLHDHKVVSKILAAVVVFIVMFPGWLRYIVPAAELSVADHELQMELEAQNRSEDLKKREHWILKAVKGISKKDREALFGAINDLLETEVNSHLSRPIQVSSP